MSVSIDDLRPKTFNITVKGVTLTCKPLRLSHALIITKVGEVFQNPKQSTKEDVRQAERDIDEVLSELIPELTGIELDIESIVEVITQLTEHSQPSDNSELKKEGVSLDGGPKEPLTMVPDPNMMGAIG
jgi:hypothetical protein